MHVALTRARVARSPSLTVTDRRYRSVRARGGHVLPWPACSWDPLVVPHAGDVESQTGLEHAVIARYRLTGEGFGDPSERAAVRAAQDVLREEIQRVDAGEFDGNEFGGGEVVLYAYGPDADVLFAVMAPTLRSLPFRPAQVVLRYGSVSDPSAIQRRIDL